MKMRLLGILLGIALLPAGMAYSQVADDESAEISVADSMSGENVSVRAQYKTKLIPLSHQDDGKAIEAEVEPLAAVDQMSIYVKELGLTPQQIDLAKYISDDSRIKQEQLLKSVYLLKEQAKSLEEKSLQDFRGILTPEQRKKFDQLRQWYERKYYFENN